MPDMERIINKLLLDRAKELGPEKHAYMQGYIAGKTEARKEILVLFCTALVLYALIALKLF